MEPQKYADENNIEYNGEVNEKGVFFAEFSDETSTFYMRLFDGVVYDPQLTEIGSRGNYTYGIVEGEDIKRMIDDSGVNERLINYL